MNHPSWIATANGLGTSTVASSFHSPNQRLRSFSLQPYSQDFQDLRLVGTPTRWHPDYSQTRNTAFLRSQSAGSSISSTLEPIPEGRAADYRQKRELAASPANNVKDRAQRRHSEGDLLGDPGRWRFAKRSPQQEYRRRSSQGDFRTSSDFAVRSGVSGQVKRKLSVIAWPDDTSDVDERLDSSSRIVHDARPDFRRQSSQASDPDLSQRRVSLHTMRQNSQTDASLENGEEVTSKSRRKSAGSRSVADSDNSAPTWKASTISLTATAIASSQSLASRATLAAVDIPLDFLQPPVSRVSTVVRPLLMLTLVMTLAGSLGAALYFAVVLNRAQAREIEYLRATLRFHLQESEYQRLEAQTSSQKDEFAQVFCKEVDQCYQSSLLSSTYRGCRVSSLHQQELLSLLYFDKPQNVTVTSLAEDILKVLRSAASNHSQPGGVVILGSVRFQVSNITVSLTVSSQGPESEGSGSPVKETVSSGHNSAQSSLRTSAVTPVTRPSVTPVTPPSVTPVSLPSVTPVTLPSVTPVTLPSVTPVSLPSVTPVPLTSVTPVSLPSVTPVTLPSVTPVTLPSVTPVSLPSVTPVPLTSVTPVTPPSVTPVSPPSVTPVSLPSVTPVSLPSVTPPTYASTGQVHFFNASAAASTSLTPVPARDPLHPCLPNESDTRYRYPGSCSIYFQCLHGRAITMACASGLVFDVTLNVCQVTTPDCHETSTTENSDAARPCEKMGGMYYPHPVACNLYIQCSNNITNIRICNDGLVFSPETSTCIQPTPDLVCP